MTKTRPLVAALLGLTILLGSPRHRRPPRSACSTPASVAMERAINFDPPGAVQALEDSANAVAVQPDGKIVTAGSLGCRLDLLRSNVDRHRSLQQRRFARHHLFSGDGFVLTHFSSGAVGLDVALPGRREDSWSAGAAHAEATDVWAFALARYRPRRDPGRNLQRRQGGSVRCRARGARVERRNPARWEDRGRGRRDASHYEPDGSLDMGFGSGGHVDSPFMTDVAIRPNGPIVTAGFAFAKFGVYRYETDGTPDMTFDSDGKATVGGTANREREANSLALQSNGKIVVAGGYRKPGSGGSRSGGSPQRGRRPELRRRGRLRRYEDRGAVRRGPGRRPGTPTAGSCWPASPGMGPWTKTTPTCRRSGSPASTPEASSTSASAATARS